MTAGSGIRSVTVEFLRSGPEEGLVAPENTYIRTLGGDRPVDLVGSTLRHRELLRLLRSLRYGFSSEKAEDAALALASEADRFLPAIEVASGHLTQVDVVTQAAELWPIPFEACYATHPNWLSDADYGMVLTRRIRSGFSEQTLPWPDRPRLLFVHAPATRDLEQPLIDKHTEVLQEALAPWSHGRAVGDDLLRVEQVATTTELKSVRADYRPSYIHLLAHGALCAPDPEAVPGEESWGLRLGYEGEPGVSPQEIASLLTPADGLPLVVTVAACDSANASQVLYSNYSVVQELHRRGIPVVVGSQLPLTKTGSAIFAAAFYRRLLRGHDVRHALHSGRVAVHQSRHTSHDWLSLVGYIRLPPEGYAEYLMEFGLRAELGMLDAQQRRADRLSSEGGPRHDFAEVETHLTERIISLERREGTLPRSRQDLLDECGGLLASANKRLAELLFSRAALFPENRDADLNRSRAALAKALGYYRRTYHHNINSHWVGIQELALEAAFRREFSHRNDWQVVLRAAQLARDANPTELWACGTLAELWLLAPLAGQPVDLEPARVAIRLLHERARGHRYGKFARESTRRQLSRYITWWRNDKGFFPGGRDLSGGARQLVNVLDEMEAHDALRHPES
jgi:CHAT domain